MLSSNTSAVSGDTVYIEDVFSTYLYTGNATARSISNGIDLSTKGGLIWTKCRGAAANHALVDTSTWASNKVLISNSTSGLTTATNTVVSSFNTDGYSLGTDAQYTNANAQTFASWTFRKQPKFFDVVTYTGTGVARTIAHNLGAVPGCIIVKRTDAAGNGWLTYHAGANGGTNPQNYGLYLSNTNPQGAASSFWNNTAPTSSVFTVGTDADSNTNGGTYVAYLFAHNAGGFGASGTDNVISCGTVTTDGSGNATINLGYEPQWVIVKRTDSTGGHWFMLDSMRDFTANSSSALLAAATSAESGGYNWTLNSTGFKFNAYTASATFIYIAIRRGPMKVPTDGTKVFYPSAISNAVDTKNTIGFPTDLVIDKIRGSGTEKMRFFDRLRGLRSPGLSNTVPELVPSDTAAEASNGSENPVVDNTAFYTPSGLTSAYGNIIFWNFKRAPSFFDEVCYTGTGSNMTVAHNLGVAPELMIVKRRNAAGWNWAVYAASQGATNRAYLNDTSAFAAEAAMWNSTAPTASVFSVGSGSDSNPASGATMVAYLFATCPGVSKVGSFVLSGSDQTINCGFAAGARFILLKDTGTAGRNWHVWDTARGINSGATEPYLDLNTTAAESTIRDWIEPNSSGFTVKAAYAASEGGTGQTFIYLAIA